MKQNDIVRKRRISDAGFSIVELIVVVAIMTVLLSTVFMGIGMLNSRPVEECAKKMEVSLKNNRITTMGKLSAEIEYYVDGEGYIVVKETINGDSTVQQIGEKGIIVSYSYDDGVSWTEISASNKLNMKFNRSTGGLSGLGSSVTKVLIKVERGDREMLITVDKLTGRVSID